MYVCIADSVHLTFPCSQVVIFVYDITNYASFDDLSDWLEVVRKVTDKADPKPHLALVGNKGDCISSEVGVSLSCDVFHCVQWIWSIRG